MFSQQPMNHGQIANQDDTFLKKEEKKNLTLITFPFNFIT